MLGRHGKQTYWAVEFTGEQVRLCCFRAHGSHVEIKQCQTRPVEGFDFAEFRAESGVDRSGDAEILCAVPRSEVLLKPFVVPRSDKIDLHRVASLKLEQLLAGLDWGATLWGYAEDGQDADGKHTRVVAATVSRSYVEGLIGQYFGNAEQPVFVECAALAALRAYRACRTETARCELVADCAPEGASVFLLIGGTVESAHFIPAHRSLEVAVNEICRLALPVHGKRDEVPVEVVTCLGGEMAERLADELRNTLTVPIHVGLERPASWIADPSALPREWNVEWHRIAGLIEVALAGGDRAINFVASAAPRQRTGLVRTVVGQVRATALIFSFVGLVAASFFVHRAIAEHRENVMDQVIERGQGITADLFHKEQALKILTAYRDHRYELTKILFSLALELAPQGVTLDSLTLNSDGSIGIMGRCRSYAEGQEFVRKLNDSKLFTKAQLPTQRRDRDFVTFKLQCSLTPAARKSSK
ncbi:PilN domain-containing protein [Candidatus Sumerlaeota bacterium]|nr:PilN domain-containing protein [Candidatus Sumerlaeota bacterium]